MKESLEEKRGIFRMFTHFHKLLTSEKSMKEFFCKKCFRLAFFSIFLSHLPFLEGEIEKGWLSEGGPIKQFNNVFGEAA